MRLIRVEQFDFGVNDETSEKLVAVVSAKPWPADQMPHAQRPE